MQEEEETQLRNTNAGVVWLAGNTVWSTPERIRGEVLTTMRYTNRCLPYLTLPYLRLWHIQLNWLHVWVTNNTDFLHMISLELKKSLNCKFCVHTAWSKRLMPIYFPSEKSPVNQYRIKNAINMIFDLLVCKQILSEELSKNSFSTHYIYGNLTVKLYFFVKKVMKRYMLLLLL